MYLQAKKTVKFDSKICFFLVFFTFYILFRNSYRPDLPSLSAGGWPHLRKKAWNHSINLRLEKFGVTVRSAVAKRYRGCIKVSRSTHTSRFSREAWLTLGPTPLTLFLSCIGKAATLRDKKQSLIFAQGCSFWSNPLPPVLPPRFLTYYVAPRIKPLERSEPFQKENMMIDRCRYIFCVSVRVG